MPGPVADHEGLRWTRPDQLQTTVLAVTRSGATDGSDGRRAAGGRPEGSVQPYPVAYPAVNAVTAWSWGETNRQAALENLRWVFNYALLHLELTVTVRRSTSTPPTGMSPGLTL